MSTKFSLFPSGTAPSISADQVVGLQGGVDVRWTMQQLATLFGVKKYAANFGDGTTVAYVITHSLATLDVKVSVYRNAAPFDEIICDIQHTSTNTVTLLFSIAPTTNQFRVLVWA